MSYRIREVAERANVPEGFVRRLVSVGALPGEEEGLGPREVRRARLLHSWEAAGLPVEAIVALVDRGALSLTFLDAPVMATPKRLDQSYEQLAADRGVPLALVQALHQALGFAPPDPADRAGEDDVTVLDVAELFRATGADDEATLRLLAVYADGLRRIAKAEADYYENNIERRLRGTGLDERVPQPPAVCFVDLTGYTLLTEERGDEAAAHVAGRLASLVNDISRAEGVGPSGGWETEDPFPGAPDGRVRRTRHGRARPHGRPAAGPCGHPYRSCHLPGRGRVRKDRERPVPEVGQPAAVRPTRSALTCQSRAAAAWS